jgi:hypothetical protein
LFGLLFNFSTLNAAEEAEQVVVTADEVDLAKVQAGGKVVLISSGVRGGGFRAIDDNHRTTFRFSSDDPRPTLIVQLIENRPVHRVSAVVGSKSGKIDVYLLNGLPRLPSDLDLLNPIGSIVDPMVAREASIQFAPQNARYVALRWTWTNQAGEPLNVAEVSAFSKGDSPAGSAALASDPPIYLVGGPPILPTISP